MDTLISSKTKTLLNIQIWIKLLLMLTKLTKKSIDSVIKPMDSSKLDHGEVHSSELNLLQINFKKDLKSRILKKLPDKLKKLMTLLHWKKL